MPQQTFATAYIALGSNLGDRLALLRSARSRLAQHPAAGGCQSSPLYETAPVGGPDGQGPFLNAVLRLTTALSPQQLLAHCLTIESELGRTRNVYWGPRTIDLDLLLFDDLLLETTQLHLPHPRLHLRRFVLLPLADLAPGLLHPLLRQSMTDLAADCPDTGAVRRLHEDW